MIGRVFNGRYRITERIGIGGMAEVYKAQDQVLGRTVAIKVMLPQYANDPDFTARFRQEAASAANLSSPYIVNIYDWGQDNGIYFIVMEYVRGTDLKSAIRQRGAINQRKVAEIGSQVCQALYVAHGQDIIHRDIKPQNIMVQPDGNVKVMDFGIATVENSVKAQTSSVLGTAHYISPEQAQGKDLAGTSDLYSLGCALYEASTGQVPFDGPDAVSVAMQQVNDLPTPPRQIRPEIHPDLEAIILKAMEKHPANRFQTAREMRQALDDFLMGRPVSLGGVSSAPTSVIGAISPITPSAAALDLPGGTSVMPALDLDGAGTSGRIKSTTYHMAGDTHERKGLSGGAIAGIVIGVLALVAVIAGFALNAAGVFNKSTVPDVLGKEQTAAVQMLEEAGYEVALDEAYDADTVAGRVSKVDPGVGVQLDKGETVTLVISLGVERGTIPNLEGMTTSEAERAIREAGFDAQYGGNENSDTAKKDTVSRQDPAANEERDKGTTVIYWISTGPEEIEVPNVVGKDEDDATGILQDAGFNVTALNSESYNASVSAGKVESQSTSGGKLPKGSNITIIISIGPDPATLPHSIPSVEGEYLSNARDTLENAGFEVLVNEQYSDSVAEGVVISQDRSGEALWGTTITLTVSKGPHADPLELLFGN